jgi:hypothetical protein
MRKTYPTHMANEHHRIAALRLALAEVLSCPDVRTARMAEAALNADDAAMRLAALDRPKEKRTPGERNRWHGVD